MATKKRFPNLTTDLQAAREAGQKAIEGMADGGTCNFDSLLFYVGKDAAMKRQSREFEEAVEAAGLSCFYRKHGFSKGYIVSVRLGGQAATRTKATEVACEALQAKGYQVSMYYQMD